MSKKIKAVIYAEPGVGKSTFVSKAKNPFFIATDGNFEWLGLPDKNHAQVTTWEQAKQIFAKLNGPEYSEFDTICLDLTEDLFKWCEYEYCKRNKINHMSDLGFGKAYDETRNEFYIELSKVLGLDKHVILLTHGLTKVEKDRRGVELTKFIPSDRIPSKVWDMIEGRVRYFLRAYVKGEETAEGKMIKKRYLSIIPKENEFGIARGLDESVVPEDIPLDWNTFTSVIGVDDTDETPRKVVVEQPKPIIVNREPDFPSETVRKVVVTAEQPKVVETPKIVETPKVVEQPKLIVEDESNIADEEEITIPSQPVQTAPVAPTPVEQPKVSTREMTQAEKLAAIREKLKRNQNNN